MASKIKALHLLASAFVTKADNGLAATVHGSVDAVGESTVAILDTTVRVLDLGPITVSFGKADLSAAASSGVGKGAYASAQESLDVFGADLVLSRSSLASGSGETDGKSWWAVASKLAFVAVDLKNFDPVHGQISIATTKTGTITSAPDVPSGNVALANINVKAVSGNSYADVAVDVVAIEDRLSTVSAAATVGVGGTHLDMGFQLAHSGDIWL